MLTSRLRIWRREFWAHVNANTGRTQTANYSQWLETCLRASGMRIRVGILMMHVARIWHREGWRSPGAQGISSPKTKIYIYIFYIYIYWYIVAEYLHLNNDH